jgi:hypothetical protein
MKPMSIAQFLPRFVVALVVSFTIATPIAATAADDEVRFRRVRTQFIAALGDPAAVSGSGAQHWGIWRVDPGPRGVWLRDFKKLEAANGVAPAKWQFDAKDWWVDENGLLMEKPSFPVLPGKYVVTGDRSISSILTIHPADEQGERRWELSDGAQLYDVTHLPCRSARYTPESDNEACSPANASREDYPVKPGAIMPSVRGCKKKDYSVLFLVGVAISD